MAIFSIVVNNPIPEYPGCEPGFRNIRHIEDEDTTGVVASHIVVYVSIGGVFDLNASNVEFSSAVPDNHIVRLANIDTSV